MSDDFSFSCRVYIEDTDAAGIVYYANYLKFMERARSEWLRELGLAQSGLRAAGVQFVVRRCELELLKPARLDDGLVVTVGVGRRRGASLDFEQKIWRADELLCEGRVRVACVDADSLKPRALPATLIELFQKQAGE